MSTRFLTEKDKTDLLQLFDDYSKEVSIEIEKLCDRFYDKDEINNMIGSYVEEIAGLIGGI